MNQTVQHQLSILIVEDEYHTRMAIARKLQADGHTVAMAEEAITGLRMALNAEHDAILLDLGLPGGGGLDLLVKLRKFSQVPVIFISQFEGVEERLQALEAGADDFLVKPVDSRELMARLRNLVQRVKQPASQSAVLVTGDLMVDLASRSALRAGVALELTPTEFDMLVMLVHNSGRLLPRDELEAVMPNRTIEKAQKSNILDVYILRLRRKIGKERISNRRGLGFIFHG
jgi:DNA-binding response OmpR family regulator